MGATVRGSSSATLLEPLPRCRVLTCRATGKPAPFAREPAYVVADLFEARLTGVGLVVVADGAKPESSAYGQVAAIWRQRGHPVVSVHCDHSGGQFAALKLTSADQQPTLLSPAFQWARDCGDLAQSTARRVGWRLKSQACTNGIEGRWQGKHQPWLQNMTAENYALDEEAHLARWNFYLTQGAHCRMRRFGSFFALARGDATSDGADDAPSAATPRRLEF